MVVVVVAAVVEVVLLIVVAVLVIVAIVVVVVVGVVVAVRTASSPEIAPAQRTRPSPVRWSRCAGRHTPGGFGPVGVYWPPAYWTNLHRPGEKPALQSR